MRCAVCGSTRITIETKKEGYNTKKGLLGMAVFGSSGAILGASGNDVTYYHCGDCGQTLNKVMGHIDEQNVEMELNFQKKHPNFERKSTYQEKYPNAGWIEKKEVEDVSADSNQDKVVLMDSSDEWRLLDSLLECLISNQEGIYMDEIRKEFANYSMSQLESMLEQIIIPKELVKKEITENGTLFIPNKDKIKSWLISREKAKKEEIEKKEEKRKTLFDNEIPDEILKVLKSTKQKMTIPEMQNHSSKLSEYSYQTISFNLKRLYDYGKIKKEIIDRTVYFSIK